MCSDSPTGSSPSPERGERLWRLAALIAVAALAGGCRASRAPVPVGVGVLQVDGVVRATERAALSPVAWSPDARRFAYGTRDGVWVHALGDPAGTRVADGRVVTAVTWSAAADVIAYVDRGTLWTVRPDGGARRRIELPGIVTAAAWAPGGDRLAGAVRGGAGAGPPGSGPLWWTSPDGAIRRNILWTPGARDVAALGWFPDALYLFVGVAAPASEATAEWWRVRIAYPDFQRLAAPPSPALDATLSPSGQWIAFVAAEGGRERVYAVRPDGSGLHPVTPPVARVAGLSWAHAGETLAYGVMLDEGRAEVHAAALSGSPDQVVATYSLEFPDPSATLSLAWAPDDRLLAYGANTGVLSGPVWLVRFRR